ncbi:MAG: hypothetical protein QRY74_03775 [Chlamydia sp.]
MDCIQNGQVLSNKIFADLIHLGNNCEDIAENAYNYLIEVINMLKDKALASIERSDARIKKCTTEMEKCIIEMQKCEKKINSSSNKDAITSSDQSQKIEMNYNFFLVNKQISILRKEMRYMELRNSFGPIQYIETPILGPATHYKKIISKLININNDRKNYVNYIPIYQIKQFNEQYKELEKEVETLFVTLQKEFTTCSQSKFFTRIHGLGEDGKKMQDLQKKIANLVLKKVKNKFYYYRIVKKICQSENPEGDTKKICQIKKRANLETVCSQVTYKAICMSLKI